MRNYSAQIFSIFFTLLTFNTTNSHAQELSRPASSYAKNTIETLTSDEYAGRGYVEDGMNKAADFIATEFERLGLQPIGDSYFQAFEMPINVIQDASLTINSKELQYGIDFIVKPNSKSIQYFDKEYYTFNPEDFAASLNSRESFIEFMKRDMMAQNNKHITFPPHQFEIDSLNQYYKNWPTVYRPEENKDRAIFFFTPDKLTSSLSQTQDSISQFFIKDNYYTNDLSIDNYSINSQFVKDFKTKNVIGKIEGENKDSLIVITAHFDHLGKVGNTIFHGASDNASGTAFLLELAQHFSQTKPKYSLIFIAFAAEEAGMIGSNYFADNPLVNLADVKFLLNFDIIGAGEDGIQIVNSSIFEKEYELLSRINSEQQLTPQIKKRGEACNSDHCPFYEKGVPSFFIYTLGGPGHYHDPLDTAETLNLYGFENLKQLFVRFIQEL